MRTGKLRQSKICKNCGIEFNPWAKSNLYCSRDCYNNARKRDAKVCPICVIEFAPRKTSQIYCSKKCASRIKSGKVIDAQAYLQLGISQGIVWAGAKIPDKTKDKTTWLCHCGKIWGAAYSNVLSGGTKECPECQRETAHSFQRLTDEDYRAAPRDGIAWVGRLPKNTAVCTLWKCAVCNHEFMMAYSSAKGGSGCPECYKHKDKSRHTKKDYEETALSYGFVFTGPKSQNVNHKTWFECSSGHRLETSLTKIKSGRGCPHCSGRARKTKEDYLALAEKRAFVFLGPKPSSVLHKTSWICSEGHEWSATFAHINNGTGCPYCAGKMRKTPDDYHELANERQFLWLGPEVPNAQTNTNWECLKCGNTWSARYSNIKTGYGCPRCVNMVNGVPASKQQVAIAQMIGAEVNYQYDDSRRRIDAALPSKKIAVEYDCYYWHGGKGKKDYARAMSLVELEWKVLSVKARTDIPTLEQLNESIAQLETHPYIELILDDWGKGNTRESI